MYPGRSGWFYISAAEHHYIPQFYLRRWAGDDDRICEFRRPYKKINLQRVYPKQTGFLDRLYEKRGVPQSIAQQVEDKFMSPVDNFAAKALDLIETDVDKIKNDAEQRSAWSLFLITLMSRMPEDLAAITAILEDDWKRDLPLHRLPTFPTDKLNTQLLRSLRAAAMADRPRRFPAPWTADRIEGGL